MCGVDTKSYKLRPFLLHSTNSLFTHNFLSSPFYSSSCNQHTTCCIACNANTAAAECPCLSAPRRKMLGYGAGTFCSPMSRLYAHTWACWSTLTCTQHLHTRGRGATVGAGLKSEERHHGILRSGTLDSDRSDGFLMSRLRRMQQFFAVQTMAMDILTAHSITAHVALRWLPHVHSCTTSSSQPGVQSAQAPAVLGSHRSMKLSYNLGSALAVLAAAAGVTCAVLAAAAAVDCALHCMRPFTSLVFWDASDSRVSFTMDGLPSGEGRFCTCTPAQDTLGNSIASGEACFHRNTSAKPRVTLSA